MRIDGARGDERCLDSIEIKSAADFRAEGASAVRGRAAIIVESGQPAILMRGATNLTEALLRALEARGATEVFGIPGDFALLFFDVLERSGIMRCITLSHEPALGFAADAAARLRGGLSAVAVTYGAGAFNVVNAIAGAYAERSPVVVIAAAPSAQERAGALLLHHQAKSLGSQLRVFQEVPARRRCSTMPSERRVRSSAC